MTDAELEADYDRKARGARVERSEPIRALLRERFAEERRACAELFGGPASAWPDATY